MTTDRSYLNLLPRFLPLLLPLVAIGESACAGAVTESSGDSPASTGRQTSALSTTAVRPVPYCPSQGKACFPGGTVELIVADAMAECGTQSVADVNGAEDLLDVYLATVRQDMVTARCGENFTATLDGWTKQRAEAGCNVDAGNSAEFRTYPLQPVNPSFNATYGTEARPCGGGQESDRVPLFIIKNIHNTALNACMAQRLRAVMPGTAGAEGIVLDRNQQRELLQVIHDRAQLAMIGYSRLMLAAQASGSTACTEGGQAAQLPDALLSVAKWITGQPTERIDGMGHDMATLSEIHVQTTRDLLSLFSRSASAREASSSDTQSINDRDWAKGGWRQRAAALLFGGDPLSTGANSSAGWSEVLPTTENWPSHNHVTKAFTSPESYVFSRLVRECDAQNLVNASTSPFVYQDALTADTAYKNVEACLRTKACTNKVAGQCVAVTAADLPGNLPIAGTLLWKQHRILPEHAQESMKVLAERIIATDPASPPPFLVRGATTVASSGGFLVTHLDKDAMFEPTPATHRAGAFSSLVGTYPTLAMGKGTEYRTLFMRVDVDSGNRASRQGFMSTADSAQRDAERIRMSGSLAVLGNLRDAYVEALLNPSPNRNRFSSRSPEVLKMLDGAIGTTQLSIRPNLTTNSASSNPNGFYYFDVLTSDDDPYFAGAAPEDLRLYVLRDSPQAAALATWDGSSINGQTIANLIPFSLGDLVANPTLSMVPNSNLKRFRFAKTINLPANGTWTVVVARGPLSGTRSYRSLGSALKLQKMIVGGVASRSYDPIMPQVSHVIPTGGSLGATLDASMLPDVGQPARPATDAFGLPYRWVPPTNPTLSASVQLQSPSAYYLKNAEDAAVEATEAVGTALSKLEQEEADDAALAASAIKSKAVIDDQAKALCGDANPKCDLSLTDYQFDSTTLWSNTPQCSLPDGPITQALTACAQRSVISAELQAQLGGLFGGSPISSCGQLYALQETGTLITDMRCSVRNVLSLTAGRVRIPTVLSNHIGDPAVPQFAEYAGGKMQASMIRWWQAHRDLVNGGNNLKDTLVAAEKRADALVNIIGLLDPDGKAACRGGGGGSILGMTGIPHYGGQFFDAIGVDGRSAGAFGGSVGGAIVGGGAAGPPGAALGATLGGAGGGMLGGMLDGGDDEEKEAQLQVQCDAARAQFGIAQNNAVAEAWAGFASMNVATRAYGQSLTNVYLATAELAQIAQEARLTIGTAQLEQKLTASNLGLRSQFGLHRRIHSYDLWRAQALLEGARRQAVIARRAVESEYLVDLSMMTKDEPLVSAPSAWADEVYQYDLSLPSSVGLSAGQQSTGGIYPNKLKDYVKNLQLFVQGYPIARPTAVATNDAELISIPGPFTTQTVKNCSDNLPSAGEGGGIIICNGEQCCSTEEVLSPGASAWEFFCIDKWVPANLGFKTNPCNFGTTFTGAGPTKARVVVRLDPWGRNNTLLTAEPFESRHNARWGRFSVNMVGTGILDCNKAADPAACYAQAFVRFNVRHLGPSWISDSGSGYHLLPVPNGFVEAGKALAAEQWLDPVANGFSKPFVAAVQRSEFFGRPFYGSYVFEFELGPEVRPDRFERVQILTESNYWVTQK